MEEGRGFLISMTMTRAFTKGERNGLPILALKIIPWLKSPGLGRETTVPGQGSVFLPKLNGKRLHAGQIAENILGEIVCRTRAGRNSTRDTTRPLRWTVFPKGQALMEF